MAIHYTKPINRITSNKITVHVPGISTPLNICKTPHIVYNAKSLNTTVGGAHGSNFTTSCITGDDIETLFKECNVIRVVQVKSIDTVTGKPIMKEGILLKRKKQMITV